MARNYGQYFVKPQKKSSFLVAGPLRGRGGGGQKVWAPKEKKIFFFKKKPRPPPPPSDISAGSYFFRPFFPVMKKSGICLVVLPNGQMVMVVRVPGALGKAGKG